MSDLPEILPPGYVFVDHSAITSSELIALRDAGDWGTERNEELWARVLEQSIAAVGVKDAAETLVGIGFLAGNERHAVLCDFIVHPEHTSRGIGTAILNRRVNIAEDMQIPYLYTELAPTNRLRRHYEDLGFIATGHAYTRAARRHPSELTES
jgi:GNAT superfamily N-acetyltransferase